MSTGTPNRRYRHLFAVLRVDPGTAGEFVENLVSVVSVFGDVAEAEAEADRLATVNEDKGCRYVVMTTRYKGQAWPP